MNCLKSYFNFLCFLVCLLVSSSLSASTIYVDVAANGNSTGTDWLNAHTNLLSAINAAQSGDIIKIAEGVYYNSQPSYILKDRVSIYGGYPSLSRGIPLYWVDLLRNFRLYPTILTHSNRDITNPIILINSNLSNQTILDGITIKAINCVEVNTVTQMFFSPQFIDCIFEGTSLLINRGEHGFLVTNATNSYVLPQFLKCEFKNFNTACFRVKKRIGGGFYAINPMFYDCKFYDSSCGIDIYDLVNAAMNGGVMVQVDRCMFYNLKSSTVRKGGAFVIDGNNSRLIYTYVNNSAFYNNDAVLTGQFSNLSRLSTFSSCVNSFRNCTFYRNTGSRAFSLYDKDQGLLDSQQLPILFLYNCISWGNINTAGKWIELDEGIHVDVKNSLLEITNVNSNGQYSNPAITLLNAHPTINRIKANSQTIFAQNPQFVSTSFITGINLRVQSSSPAINTGDNNIAYISKDLGGVNNRILDNIVDMGAYEFCSFGDGACNPIEIKPIEEDKRLGKQQIGTTNILDNDIIVFPNPATNQINLKTTAQIVSVQLIDMKGQVLRSWENQQQLNIQNLPKGLYILKVTTSENTQSVRFVKE